MVYYRFTPTSVGNTIDEDRIVPHSFGSPPPAWGIRMGSRIEQFDRLVHPHQRGEYPRLTTIYRTLLRFTPTSVGNTTLDTPWEAESTGSPPPAWGIREENHVFAARQAVHPHQRGEYDNLTVADRGDARFTPTSVGNTLISAKPPWYFIGSPPPAWGIPRRKGDELDRMRFTPTSVGNTATNTTPTNRSAVHPHQRGEYVRSVSY